MHNMSNINSVPDVSAPMQPSTSDTDAGVTDESTEIKTKDSSIPNTSTEDSSTPNISKEDTSVESQNLSNGLEANSSSQQEMLRRRRLQKFSSQPTE
jgi:hypothetical protein